MLNWDLSPIMRAICNALDRLGGVARWADLSREAGLEEQGEHGDQAHFAKGTQELERRGILESWLRGDARMFQWSEAAWRERGRTGPPPRDQQIGLL